MMEWNRDHFLGLGIVLLLLGAQMRLVETVVLNEKTSQVIAERVGERPVVANSALMLPPLMNAPLRRVTPPRWLGWALLSVGGVLVLHALALKKPDGE